MSKVFISYARDESVGQQLAALTQSQLQSAGYEVFRDVTGLSPGDRWDTKLEFELETSDIVVLIVSEKVRQSKWVHNEVSMAMEIGLPVIPVLSEKVRMPLWLRHLQALDFSEHVEWAKLLSAVETHCGGLAKTTIPVKQPKANSPLTPAWAQKAGNDQYGRYADLEINQVIQRFRFIEAGTFWMGSPDSEPEREEGEERHQVTLSQPFWLANTACTQALWQSVMGNNPAYFSNDLNNPVETVSWNDAQQFIETVNSLLSGITAQLPTEAQWEYACRAGTVSPFSLGNMITPEQVNYHGDYPYKGGEAGLYRKATIPVTSLAANLWGLYEVHGNVFEWCQDAYQGHLGNDEAIDPLYEKSVEQRMLRGGSWGNEGRDCRSAYRGWSTPDDRDNNVGFRLALIN